MRARHPNYKGGRVITPHGYALIFVGKAHHLADCRGYAYEHRLVAEQKIGRRLKKGENVHHINGDKKDNDPSNIEVTENFFAHKNKHRTTGHHRRKFDEDNPIIECACGCKQTFLKYDTYHRPRRYARGCSWRKGKRC